MNFQAHKLHPFGILITPKGIPIHVRDLDHIELKKLFLEHQILVLRGFKTFQDSNEFAEYCELWGQVSLWPFGKVLELVQHENPKDHIFDSSYVPMHWDGMYRPQVPEYQIFHCVKAPLAGHGGRTTFSNTLKILETLDPKTLEKWKGIVATYSRRMEFYDSKTVSPLICKHPLRGFNVIRYNEAHIEENGPFINPPDQEFQGLAPEELPGLHRSLKESLYNPQNLYAHEWIDHDVVITDNFTLLHGRESFVSNSPRHIQRVQVESDPPFPNPGLESYQ